MELDQDERAHLEWSRALSTDNEGREVYAGLSFAESENSTLFGATRGSAPASSAAPLKITGAERSATSSFSRSTRRRACRSCSQSSSPRTSRPDIEW